MSVLIHGGNLKELSAYSGKKISELKDFSSNINPLGPPMGLLDFLNENIKELVLLPEYDSSQVKSFIANLINIDKKRIVPGSGTTEFIHRLPETLKPERVLICGPTYSDYEKACKIRNIESDYIFFNENNCFDSNIGLLEKKIKNYSLVFICNPNNPTGTILSKNILIDLIKKNPQTFFVIDETYLPFEKDFFKTSFAAEDIDNLYVLLSFSKIFTLPGLRLGFMILPSSARPEIYDLPWKVNSVAAGVCSFLNSNMGLTLKFLNETWRFIEDEKNYFINDSILSKYFEFINQNNIYTLARIKNMKSDSGSIFSFLLEKDIVIRDCSNIMGLGTDYIRFSFKTHEENIELKENLIKYSDLIK
ncbi:MAG: aminotransferase class I/II-fold pyridoxal phosphate-dependent enzyme [Desulfobacteraceae bacterium]|nr:aminotransferase class I/II-fold pyridoxal phosphate-dependent enzyme [Desulfobacteraceae bacterium]MCB9494477.1 aminotransferase class I/II-fold pyridoxal phosphate-dependent enzyme [Desulfobacteraceae bacterium]